MKKMVLTTIKRYTTAVFILFLFPLSVYAQTEFEGKVRIDKTIHDFGDILVSAGPQKCKFAVENISAEAIVINRVVTSCGCTEPDWTKSPLRPGEKGYVNVIYKNDAGPYPFDKTITVYITGLSKPVLLHIRGTVFEKEKKIEEIYSFRIGALGLREEFPDIGQIEQGLSSSAELSVANLSSSPIRVTFSPAESGLSFSLSPNPLPAHSKGMLTCTVDTKKMSPQKWGKTILDANVGIDGKIQVNKLKIKTLIKENYTSLTDEQRKAGSIMQFNTSSQSFGTLRKGEKKRFSFSFTNKGKSPLVIYKVDSSEPGTDITFTSPVEYGKTGTMDVTVTGEGEKGEILYILTAFTNSPTRPMANVFITGTIE